jgi:phosphoribosylanthranilate isomerase
MSPFIKICGITNVEDALWAAHCGATAIGLVFAEESPRKITFSGAAEILSVVPETLVRVGVFVNEPLEHLNDCVAKLGLHFAQLHGEESPDYCKQVKGKVIKAFRVSSERDLESLQQCPVDAFLLDAFTPGKRGGSGKTFDWSLAVKAKEHGVPIILSGGLNPDNVAEAVQTVSPWGVDASSGIEISPGKKDHDKVRLFVENAIRAFSKVTPGSNSMNGLTRRASEGDVQCAGDGKRETTKSTKDTKLSRMHPLRGLRGGPCYAVGLCDFR